mgnify:CR=1 FL=1
MFNRLQKEMVGHAALILFVAMLAGIGLLMSLIGGVELIPGTITQFAIPGDSGSWARTHVGGLLNALLIIAIAVIIPGLGFAEKSARKVGLIFIGTGWGNTVFYWAAMFAPNRALTFASNQFGESNLASVIGLVPGLLFAVLSMIAAVMIIRQAFSNN